MNITEVRVKLMQHRSDRLRAFCSVTIDDDFVVHDLRVIEGRKGFFVAMPSRKLTDSCPKCAAKNELKAKYCCECGIHLGPDRAVEGETTHGKLHVDVAHPINTACRDMLQRAVLEAYEEEEERAGQGLPPRHDGSAGGPEFLPDDYAEMGQVYGDEENEGVRDELLIEEEQDEEDEEDEGPATDEDEEREGDEDEDDGDYLSDIEDAATEFIPPEPGDVVEDENEGAPPREAPAVNEEGAPAREAPAVNEEGAPAREAPAIEEDVVGPAPGGQEPTARPDESREDSVADREDAPEPELAEESRRKRRSGLSRQGGGGFGKGILS